jgi:CSLREA domain-containing protein
MNGHLKTTVKFFRVFISALLLATMVFTALPVRVAHAASFVVNNNGDAPDANLGDSICQTGAGVCTLRAAIQQANNSTSLDTITFSGALATITLTGDLPAISENVFIDATPFNIVINAGAAAGNGFTISADNVTIKGFEIYGAPGDGVYVNADNATIQDMIIRNFGNHGVEIDTGNTGVLIDTNYIGVLSDGSTDAGNTLYGVYILNSPANTVRNNLISGNNDGGVWIDGAASDGNVVEGNYIGTDFTGSSAVTNGGNGVWIDNAPNTQVDGTTAAGLNVISGNTGSGVYVSGINSNGSVIQGNHLGTSLSGENIIPNTSNGVRLDGTVNVTVGGGSSAEGNLITGNSGSGVYIVNASDGISVQNNIIGLDDDGDTALGNGGNGVGITSSSTNTTVSDNTISSNTSSGVSITISSTLNTIQGNRIGLSQTGSIPLGNGSHGVYINNSADNTIDNNIIANNTNDGVSVVGASSIANTITSNSIYTNGGLGIDLNNNGVTANDGPGDPDTGTGVPNEYQNFPVFIARIEGSGVRVTGDLESGPVGVRGDYHLQFFHQTNCDGSGYGEGQTLIGTLDVQITDPSNVVSFNYLITPVSAAEGDFITASATYDQGAGQLKDTSEFSPCATIPPTTGVFVVNTAADGVDLNPGDGVCEVTFGNFDCTLRAAIMEVNAGPTPPYTIAFSIPGVGPHTISLNPVLFALPDITNSVIINGKTEPGYSGSPLIMVDGSALGGGSGFTIDANDTEILGLSIVNFSSGSGIYVKTNIMNVTIEDNYIGIEADGTTAGGNQTGIYLLGTNSCLILDNVISRNGNGIWLDGSSATGNLIQGNYIGTNPGGTLDYGNTLDGILVGGAQSNLIGGTGGGQGNLISGNNSDGIEISGGATGNLVYGNMIGTEWDGSPSIPNSGYGVNIDGANDNLVDNDNTIAFNGGSGVYVKVGVPGTGIQNLISQNSIYNNSVLDIELAVGGNNAQSAPILTSALTPGAGFTLVDGTLSSAPNSSYTIEFFSNPNPVLPGPEVKTYQLSISVTTDGLGSASFSAGIPVALVALDQVTATATDANNNTSQFSASVFVVVDPLVATLTPSPTSTPLPTNTSPPINTSPPSTNTSTPGPTATFTLVGPFKTLTAMFNSPTPSVTGTPPTATRTSTSTLALLVLSPTLTRTSWPTIDLTRGYGGGTNTPTFTITPTLSEADLTATAEAEGEDEEGGSGLSIFLWIFIGLALLFLLAGGAMELMRWLNSRKD